MKNVYTKKEIQYLVDEHHFLGMAFPEIKKHLFSEHDIAKEQFVPRISDIARKQVAKFRRSGKVPDFIRNTNAIASGSDIHSGKSSQEVAAYLDALESTMSPMLTALPVQSEEDTSDEVTDNSWICSDVGLTFIDRVINGFKVQADKLIPAGERENKSNFELFKLLMSITRENDPEFYKALPFQILNNHRTPETFIRVFDPWMTGENNCTNIQLSGDIAASLALANDNNIIKPPLLDVGECFYIDIKQPQEGKRYMSAIACEGVADVGNGKPGISISYFIEWKGLGIETIASGAFTEDDLNNNADNFAVLLFGGNFAEDVTREDLGYKEISQEALKLIGAAWSLYNNPKNIRSSEGLPLLPRNGKVLNSSLSHKASKVKKRLNGASFFKMESLNPEGTEHEPSGKKGAGWTLNHLVTVSGHFRSQACGKNHEDRKLIWIENYKKGKGSEVRPGEGHKLKLF